MRAGYHHITLRVTDLARSRAFDEGVLGFTVDQDFPGEKLRLRLPSTDTRLVLCPPLPGTEPGDRFSERRIGLDHIAVGVTERADLKSLVDTLRAAGVEAGGITDDAMGPGVVSFRDPDNVQWEFFEQR